MHEGSPETQRHHAELSERWSPSDLWADVARKTLAVAIISVTVWSACTLLHHLVELGIHRLFETAERFHSAHALLGAVVLLGIMLMAGLLRGLLLRRAAWQDTMGDGMDRALARFHGTYTGHGRGSGARYSQPTFSLAVRKLVMTTLTIGGGGSGGLEAPGVYLGESIAAGWSKVFKRPSADELRLYQLAGIAAAVGTLLQAPFAAAIFAAEIIYAGRVIYRKLAYCLFAGVLVYELNHHLLGTRSLFLSPEHGMTFVWQEYLLVTLVAVGLGAPAAMALGPLFKGAEQFFERLPVVHRAMAGALIAGVIGIGMWVLCNLHPKHILGVGLDTINEVVNGTGGMALQTWWILVLAAAAKSLATAATLKSGGSAGMLFPAMYMGALAGAAGYYLIGRLGLYAGPTVAVYAASGMAAALTTIAGVPLASIALVLEVFGSDYGPAAALSCAVCFTAARRFSLYNQREGLDDPSPSPAKGELST